MPNPRVGHDPTFIKERIQHVGVKGEDDDFEEGRKVLLATWEVLEMIVDSMGRRELRTSKDIGEARTERNKLFRRIGDLEEEHIKLWREVRRIAAEVAEIHRPVKELTPREMRIEVRDEARIEFGVNRLVAIEETLTELKLQIMEYRSEVGLDRLKRIRDLACRNIHPTDFYNLLIGILDE